MAIQYSLPCDASFILHHLKYKNLTKIYDNLDLNRVILLKNNIY